MSAVGGRKGLKDLFDLGFLGKFVDPKATAVRLSSFDNASKCPMLSSCFSAGAEELCSSSFAEIQNKGPG